MQAAARRRGFLLIYALVYFDYDLLRLHKAVEHHHGYFQNIVSQDAAAMAITLAVVGAIVSALECRTFSGFWVLVQHQILHSLSEGEL